MNPVSLAVPPQAGRRARVTVARAAILAAALLAANAAGAQSLTARGESPASTETGEAPRSTPPHTERAAGTPGSTPPRTERADLKEEQRRQAGAPAARVVRGGVERGGIAGRMPRDFDHGLLRPLAAALSASGPSVDAQASQPAPPPVTAGWADGFVVQSANGEFRLQLGLLLHADGRFALDDENATVDTFALRRARGNLRGRVAQRFEFFLNPDFAGGTLTVQDAYLDTRFSPSFIVRLGKSKTPFGLERLILISSLLFFERALPTALAPNRDVGIQVLGDLRGGKVSYAAALLNGVTDGASGDVDANDGKDLAGRLAVRPFGPAAAAPLSGLLLAVAGTTGTHAGALPTLRTSSLLQTFATYGGALSDGRLNRYSPQASYYRGRIAALAEYIHTSVSARRGSVLGDVTHDAWQLAGSYLLTADTVSERGIRPQHNFDFGNGHIGALQVAARYHTLSVGEEALALGLISAGSSGNATAWTIGLNWFLNPNIKYVLNFERTVFDDDAAGARHAENGLVLRAQLTF